MKFYHLFLGLLVVKKCNLYEKDHNADGYGYYDDYEYKEIPQEPSEHATIQPLPIQEIGTSTAHDIPKLQSDSKDYYPSKEFSAMASGCEDKDDNCGQMLHVCNDPSPAFDHIRKNCQKTCNTCNIEKEKYAVIQPLTNQAIGSSTDHDIPKLQSDMRYTYPRPECTEEERPCGTVHDLGVCRTGGCWQNERSCPLSKIDCPGDDCQCCKDQLNIWKDKECRDKHGKCYEYSIEQCHGEKHKWFYENCGKTCGFCKADERISEKKCSNEQAPCGTYGDEGVCRTGECAPNERVCELSKYQCPGTDCRCCKPKESTEIYNRNCETEESPCGSRKDQGVCRTGGCKTNERVCELSKKECPGVYCQCCKPIEKKRCSNEQAPCGTDGDEGVCRTGECGPNERVYELSKYQCPGADCRCCKPKESAIRYQRECKIEGSPCGPPKDIGLCRTGGCKSNERAYEFSKEDCPGTDCQCCKPIKKCSIEETQCGSNGDFGVCRTRLCGPQETVSDLSKDDCPGTECLCCKPKRSSYQCYCQPGYTLLSDGKTCEATFVQNSCKINGRSPCDHDCTPIPGGSYKCSCRPGFSLMYDGKTCQSDACKECQAISDHSRNGESQVKSTSKVVELGKIYAVIQQNIQNIIGPATSSLPCEDTWAGDGKANCASYLPECRDINNEYGQWGSQHCRRTCGFCQKDMLPTIDSQCKDKLPVKSCQEYKNQCKPGAQWYTWMKDNCQKYCGICNGGN